MYPKINEITKEYWSEEDFISLEKATTIKEVFSVAKNVLGNIPLPRAQVCGPVTNGGKGSIEANLAFLSETIGKLQSEGVYVFDQMPFEETFHRIVNNPELPDGYETILDDFYEPLFEGGFIQKVYFVSGWESSRGAKWEHDKANKLGMECIFLD